MIRRRQTDLLLARLDQFPAVALLGPRQVGKTTLADQIGAGRPSIYLDLEAPADREKLADAALYLSGHDDKLVIVDEVQRAPVGELPKALTIFRTVVKSGQRAPENHHVKVFPGHARVRDLCSTLGCAMSPSALALKLASPGLKGFLSKDFPL